jgi:pterin-4a-carbinolamine dehydratase
MRFAQFNERCWTGYRQAGMKNKSGRQVPNCVLVTETRRDPEDLYQPTDDQLDRLHHEFIPAWSMLDHDQLTTAYDFVDDDTAMQFVTGLDEIEQSMDHNAVVTMDNARVTVAVRTGDVDGLTRLDFEFALRVQNLADQLDGDQVPHATNQVDENLRDWFKEKWVRFGPDGKIRGDCARGSESEGKPKCLPQAKAHALGKKGRASAAARKRRQDPNPNRTGKAINVATKKK